MNLLFILLGVLVVAGISTWTALYFLNLWQVKKLIESAVPPFPNAESRYEVVDGVRLHYICRGTGHDILLLHGIAANIYCWRLVIPILAKKFRVWAVDLKGFGLSDKPRGHRYDIEAQAKLLFAFAKKHGLENFTVVGNSMGGAIAAGMAVQEPSSIKNLIMLNSAHDTRMFKFLKANRFKAFKRVMTSLAPVLEPAINPRIVKTYMQLMYGPSHVISDADVAAYMAPYTQDRSSHEAFFAAWESMLDDKLVSKLTHAKTRLLILWGSNDKLVNMRFGKDLNASIPGSQFFSHPTAGHHLQEEDPNWLAEKIENFIESQT